MSGADTSYVKAPSSSVAAADITDATAVGEALITAANEAAGRTAIAAAATVTTTRGDLIRRGASADERVALGTTGHVLTAGATDPAWAAPTVTAAQISDFTTAGRALGTAADEAAQRTALQVGRVVAYDLGDFTPEAGSESAPAAQGGGVYRFSVSAIQRYLGGVYTYDGVTYTRAYSAPHMTLTPPSGTYHIDARLRIAGHSGASVWEMVALLLRAGTGDVLLHGLSAFAIGTSGDIRGGDHTVAYPAGGAPTTERLWTSGTSWLRVVWDDGELIVYTGTGSGTAEPTAWERHSSTYVPTGQVGEVPTIVIGAPRVTSSSNSTAGASGSFSAWTADLAAAVYVRVR